MKTLKFTQDEVDSIDEALYEYIIQLEDDCNAGASENVAGLLSAFDKIKKFAS